MKNLHGAAVVLASALATTGCAGSSTDDDHGFVKVQLSRADSEAETPYSGTTQVELRMTYDDCYQDFYAANPNWGLEGEDGQQAFGSREDGGEGWMDRLCEEDVGGLAECEVIGYRQLLDDASLTVTYEVAGPLEGRVLLFGPLPSPELAGCSGGSVPSGRLDNAGIRGLDAEGETVWTVGTNSDPDSGAPGDGGALTINAAR